jgi:hypothetical protein
MTRQPKRQRSFLTDGDAIPISPAIAVKFGINAAAFLQQLHYLLTSVETADKIFNYEGGRWWVYYSYQQWVKHLPWLSAVTVKRIAYELADKGIVITRQPPRNRWNRSLWYCIDHEKLHAAVEDALPSGQNDQMPSGQNDPIDEIKKTKSKRSKRPDDNITSKTTKKKNEPAAIAALPDLNARIVAILEAWMKATKSKKSPYANKTYRKYAEDMDADGIIAEDVTLYVHEESAPGKYWHGKAVPFANVAENIGAWKAARKPVIAPTPTIDAPTDEPFERITPERRKALQAEFEKTMAEIAAAKADLPHRVARQQTARKVPA